AAPRVPTVAASARVEWQQQRSGFSSGGCAALRCAALRCTALRGCGEQRNRPLRKTRSMQRNNRSPENSISLPLFLVSCVCCGWFRFREPASLAAAARAPLLLSACRPGLCPPRDHETRTTHTSRLLPIRCACPPLPRPAAPLAARLLAPRFAA